MKKTAKRTPSRKSSTREEVLVPSTTKQIRKELLRAYEGASRTKRTESWRADGRSANSEIFQGLTTLRNRSRDLVRNNGYASQAIEELVTNHVGTGILPKIKAPRPAQELKLKALWADWAETTACDADGLHDFYGLQNLMARSLFESGEVLLRRRWRRATDSLPIPMQLQVLEPDFIDTGKNETTDSGIVVQGIAYDKVGKRVGYWLFPEHPGGRTIYSAALVSKFVPASEIIHLFSVLRPGQNRGIPRAAPVIITMRGYDEAQDALLMMMKIASCYTVFVTESDLGDDDLADDEELDLPDTVSPGSIIKLGSDQEVKFGSPPTMNGYADFSKINLRQISRGFGVPYELLSGDYSNVNFSSGRMGWLGFQRSISTMQWIVFIPRLCRTTWSWFKEGAEIMGVRTEGATSGWTPPRREMIDPAAEYKALGYAVRMGFMSLSEAIRQLGYDPEEVLNEKKKDNDLLDKLGLTLDTDPRKMTQAGMGQIDPPSEAEKETGDAKGTDDKVD